MAPPKLYMIDLCPSVRTVMLTAKAIGITLDYKQIDYSFKDFEYFMPDFIKLHPHQTVPTLVDNGYIIWESHSIIAYLIGKYANDDNLYPKDRIKRALIDEKLTCDSEICATIRCIVQQTAKFGTKMIPKDKVDGLKEIYDFLEEFLTDHQWMAGDQLTIADLSLIPSVTSADILIPIDKIKYPKLCAWIKRSQALPYYYEANQVGLDSLKSWIKTLEM